ncbi:hypothetical protein AACH06_25360 [Ideonella sp. DXS29W]|uniref:Uncharacterized protein n=1 Tax=Ideonella lacteola TaxID=2984193 RepID=A0ABU9C0G2_9BURK
MMNTRTLAAVALLSLIGTSGQAKILANAERTGNFELTTSGTQVPLPLLTGSDVTTLTVRNPKSKTTNYVLTFSAKCNAWGSLGTGWVDIDITINGQVLPLTEGLNDAFCNADTQAVRPSITLVVPMLPGDNAIQVLGRISGSTGGSLGYTSLVIHD